MRFRVFNLFKYIHLKKLHSRQQFERLNNVIHEECFVDEISIILYSLHIFNKSIRRTINTCNLFKLWYYMLVCKVFNSGYFYKNISYKEIGRKGS